MPLESLDEWETHLRPQIEGVDLLGETPLSEEEIARLGQVISDLVRQHGWGKAESLLREKYPYSFAGSIPVKC